MIIDAIDKKEAYQADRREKTAYDFVMAYDLCKDAGITIELMDTGIETVYEIAKNTDLPDDNVVKVYEAYENLKNAMVCYDEDFLAAYKSFEAVLDIYNELTEAEKDDLADMMGVKDPDEAYGTVFSDWILANMVKELGDVFFAYTEDPNAKTASAFVEKYDQIFGATGMFAEEEMEFIASAVAGSRDALDAEYEAAKALTAGPHSSPDTGDNFNPLAALAVMIAAVSATVVTMRRRCE